MSTEKTITAKSADGGLTVAELRRFPDEFDKAVGPGSYQAESSLKPKATVRFGGGIKSITVTIPGGDEQQ